MTLVFANTPAVFGINTMIMNKQLFSMKIFPKASKGIMSFAMVLLSLFHVDVEQAKIGSNVQIGAVNMSVNWIERPSTHTRSRGGCCLYAS